MFGCNILLIEVIKKRIWKKHKTAHRFVSNGRRDGRKKAETDVR